MNDTMYYKNLYTLAKTKENMICVHCGKPIMICDRCITSGWYVMKKCVGKGFIHKEKGHFHHCSKINTVNLLPQEMNEVAFPVLTEDEQKGLERYKGVENE